jgi:hypothetical protein
MKKEELIQFAKKFYDDIHKSNSNITSVSYTPICKDNIDEYVKNYYKYKRKTYVNKLNKLLDRFEKVLGAKFGNYKLLDRDWEFKRWTGYHVELLAHINKLEKTLKK